MLASYGERTVGVKLETRVRFKVRLERVCICVMLPQARQGRPVSKDLETPCPCGAGTVNK